jgi:5'-nucleotidase
MEDGNRIFVEQGQEAFDAYMREKEDVPLRPGVAYGLVSKLLALNSEKGWRRDKVSVVLLSRNSPDAGMRAMNSIEHYGLDIESAVFCKGDERFAYAQGLGAHLFLSANGQDVAAALQNGVAAATMLPEETAGANSEGEVRIAFDGDSVLFSSEADECYRAHGLDEFRRSESEKAQVPLEEGPFRPFLEALHALQQQYGASNCPVRVGMITARGLPSHRRPMHTLRHWGVRLDDVVFAGGMPKGPLLKAFRADIFFDDTAKNIDSAREHSIAAGHVPYGNGQGIVAPA